MDIHVLFAVFAALQLADAYTTWRVLRQGGRELNPIVAALIAKVGIVPGLVLAKGAALAAVIYLHLAGQMPLWLLVLFCASYVGIVANNVRQLH